MFRRVLLVSITVLLLICHSGHAQTDPANHQDNVTYMYSGKSFNTKLYADDSTLLAYGNYIPGSLIKDGEWIYFYKSGKVSKDIFFRRDMKCGTWIYYNENGSVLKKEKHHEQLAQTCSDETWGKIAVILNGLKSKGARDRLKEKQETERAKNAYKRR